MKFKKTEMKYCGCGICNITTDHRCIISYHNILERGRCCIKFIKRQYERKRWYILESIYMKYEKRSSLYKNINTHTHTHANTLLCNSPHISTSFSYAHTLFFSVLFPPPFLFSFYRIPAALFTSE